MRCLPTDQLLRCAMLLEAEGSSFDLPDPPSLVMLATSTSPLIASLSYPTMFLSPIIYHMQPHHNTVAVNNGAAYCRLCSPFLYTSHRAGRGPQRPPLRRRGAYRSRDRPRLMSGRRGAGEAALSAVRRNSPARSALLLMSCVPAVLHGCGS